jgi:hypothetical protein
MEALLASLPLRPEPRFQFGQRVCVVLNERNKTPREGTVDRLVWHFKEARWYYFLRVPGKTVPTRKVSKAYVEEDLVPVEPREA